MAAPAVDVQAVPAVADEAASVKEWRLRQLLAAGWPELEAAVLALNESVDLHRACELLACGCDTATAWEILR